jgi:hypothetical protein
MNFWTTFGLAWFGSSLLGLAMIIYDARQTVWVNWKKEPWTMSGMLLILVIGGIFTFASSLMILFYIPALERSNERAKKMAKEHARKLREAEGWVQLELFPEDEDANGC